MNNTKTAVSFAEKKLDKLRDAIVSMRRSRGLAMKHALANGREHALATIISDIATLSRLEEILDEEE